MMQLVCISLSNEHRSFPVTWYCVYFEKEWFEFLDGSDVIQRLARELSHNMLCLAKPYHECARNLLVETAAT